MESQMEPKWRWEASLETKCSPSGARERPKSGTGALLRGTEALMRGTAALVRGPGTRRWAFPAGEGSWFDAVAEVLE